MNVLLIYPPSYAILKIFQDISFADIPLNLAYLAAALEEEGHHVKILDLNIVKTREELGSFIKSNKYDIIGLSASTPLIPSCIKIIQTMKRFFPDAKIILGGWHASALPTETLRENDEIDFIVKGEGEETIKELVSAIEKENEYENVEGIAFRDESKQIVETPDRPLIEDLDSLPFPAWHLLPMDEYKKRGSSTLGGYYKKGIYIAHLITSRGCTHRCTFCADHVIYKQKCRLRSAENVLEEIKFLIRKYNIRFLYINDANFMLSQKRVKRICELILQEKIQIIWSCLARADSVSEDLLKLMKAAGCIRISYGIESGSPRILNLMNKQISIEKIREAIRLTKKVGITIYSYFIYGIPGETLQDAKLSRQFLFELKPDFLSQTMIIPYPGTDLFKAMKNKGLINTKDWESYSYFFNKILNLPNLEKIYKHQRKIQRDYYMSPSYLLKTLKNLKSIYHVNFYLRALKNYIIFFFIMR